ncbi:MerR family transcriptional regulator [Anaerocolumna sp. MB42-C2]|uniref:MerR family transcriptional regulator n=1 Tax=Anaerocolumna sp. MB42-C2 TaxID=3070997 RepID=UPI0027DF507C|nr:MerR family transcriptional regulator [Anaerocolumna sp. MB42-C2]WMJ88283.1 MerR family transcriptional regulator [Anaerocolumna sp. MB42-C2]
MKDNMYYSTGEFAKRARVSIRTIRYYDKQGILKPSFINESGYRYYTDSDFGKLQKILTLKYLGFSLDEIMDITGNNNDQNYVKQSFQLQLKLVQKKIDELQLIEQSIKDTSKIFDEHQTIDWNKVIDLIHITNMEKDLIKQYRNSVNVDIRISLHKNYSNNPIGWFRWIFLNFLLKPNEDILEIGCGNGELWRVNKEFLPKGCTLLLSDISVGMINDAKKNLINFGDTINFQVFDCHEIPAPDKSFDHVIGNHMLFYLKDREKAFHEIIRVLKEDRYFYCSTYGKDHMKEIEQLVKEFDSRIALSDINLYEIFGLENGKEELLRYFSEVEELRYNDYLIVDKEQAIIDYILSCHGNQHEFLKDRYTEFSDFIKKKLHKTGTLKITKNAGIFRCRK